MKLGIILWKCEPWKCKSLPDFPAPFSPVHNALKFYAVFGTVFPNKPITILPASTPSISMSKYTLLVTVSIDYVTMLEIERKTIVKQISFSDIMTCFGIFIFIFYNFDLKAILELHVSIILRAKKKNNK